MQDEKGDPLSMERIKKAVIDLYGAYDVLANGIKAFIERAVKEGSYAEIYKWVRQAEAENKVNLLEYQEEKPGVITGDNVHDIIATLRRRKDQQ